MEKGKGLFLNKTSRKYDKERSIRPLFFLCLKSIEKIINSVLNNYVCYTNIGLNENPLWIID